MANQTNNIEEASKAIDALVQARDKWANTTVQERIEILKACKDSLMSHSEEWVEISSQEKQIPAGSPLVGEEWTSGPYCVMAMCNALIETLSNMEGRKYVDHLKVGETASGQVSVQVVPNSIWDRLLLSGVSIDLWMQDGVTKSNLKTHAASVYDGPRNAGVSLILGAGNINSIAPLDAFQKLFAEHKVAIIKANPVNDYLTEIWAASLKPLVDFGALRIVRGGRDVGEYLCNHPEVTDIHITGAETTHDLIVWGGQEKKGKPKLDKPITSELGAVCPTIIVPGKWSAADISFQAENLATQKLHNSGFNCVACQVVILPESWAQRDAFMQALREVVAKAPPRPLYYPGAEGRQEEFASYASTPDRFERQGAAPCVVNNVDDDHWFTQNEVFAPAMSTKVIAGSTAEEYLLSAVEYANSELRGTLGANILIHPKTIEEIGKKRFEEIVADLKYGSIAINAWTGLQFLAAQSSWGAYPGHTLEDVQSGIGFVHNSFMFDKVERSVLRAPWRPFPRGVLSGQFTLLPRPPWFITNKRADKIGRALTRFQHKPSWLKLPAIFANALRG